MMPWNPLPTGEEGDNDEQKKKNVFASAKEMPHGEAGTSVRRPLVNFLLVLQILATSEKAGRHRPDDLNHLIDNDARLAVGHSPGLFWPRVRGAKGAPGWVGAVRGSKHVCKFRELANWVWFELDKLSSSLRANGLQQSGRTPAVVCLPGKHTENTQKTHQKNTMGRQTIKSCCVTTPEGLHLSWPLGLYIHCIIS